MDSPVQPERHIRTESRGKSRNDKDNGKRRDKSTDSGRKQHDERAKEKRHRVRREDIAKVRREAHLFHQGLYTANPACLDRASSCRYRGVAVGKALLLLEDGTAFEGQSLGAQGEAFGEVVFNTSITGYQEVLTDPSYRGQIVTMTYPLIGNYGIVPEDGESKKAWLSGFVVREASQVRSNWRSTVDMPAWLKQQRIVGVQGIDTRALTRHLRVNGSKHGVISTADLDVESLRKKLERTGLRGCIKA